METETVQLLMLGVNAIAACIAIYAAVSASRSAKQATSTASGMLTAARGTEDATRDGVQSLADLNDNTERTADASERRAETDEAHLELARGRDKPKLTSHVYVVKSKVGHDPTHISVQTINLGATTLLIDAILFKTDWDPIVHKVKQPCTVAPSGRITLKVNFRDVATSCADQGSGATPTGVVQLRPVGGDDQVCVNDSEGGQGEVQRMLQVKPS